MKKLQKKIPNIVGSPILCVLAACMLFGALALRWKAASLGSNLGAGAGFAAGRLAGSLEGLIEGRKAGTEDGKAVGLSAEDTAAAISNQMQQVENLEVLVSSVKLKDFHTVGRETDPTYAALYLANGTAVFTVDLSQAQIQAQNDTLHIILPQPVANLYIDESSIEKVADYQKRFFNGSAEDGFDAYLKSMVKIHQATEETLDNYDMLINSAKQAAERQVTLLAQSASTTPYSVSIEFAEQ